MLQDLLSSPGLAIVEVARPPTTQMLPVSVSYATRVGHYWTNEKRIDGKNLAAGSLHQNDSAASSWEYGILWMLLRKFGEPNGFTPHLDHFCWVLGALMHCQSHLPTPSWEKAIPESIQEPLATGLVKMWVSGHKYGKEHLWRSSMPHQFGSSVGVFLRRDKSHDKAGIEPFQNSNTGVLSTLWLCMVMWSMGLIALYNPGSMRKFGGPKSWAKIQIFRIRPPLKHGIFSWREILHQIS